MGGLEGRPLESGQRKSGAASRRQTRLNVLGDVARIFSDHPADDLSMQAVARLTGESLWYFRYHFGSLAGLFRAAALHVIDRAEARLFLLGSQKDSVIETIRCHAVALRNAVRSSEYRDMLFLVVRHGTAHGWLRDAYERRIVDRTCHDLSNLVLEVSERLNTPVVFKDGVTRRFHRRIETEFALRTLLSPRDALSDDEGDALLAEIVRETFLGTYCFDWQATNAA